MCVLLSRLLPSVSGKIDDPGQGLVKQLKWVVQACWIGLVAFLTATYFFPHAVLTHVRVTHGELAAFELFLVVLFAVTIFVVLREKYLRGLRRGS